MNNLKKTIAKNFMADYYVHKLHEISLEFKILSNEKEDDDPIHEEFDSFMIEMQELIERYGEHLGGDINVLDSFNPN